MNMNSSPFKLHDVSLELFLISIIQQESIPWTTCTGLLHTIAFPQYLQNI